MKEKKEKNEIFGSIVIIGGLALSLMFFCALSILTGAGLLNFLGFKYTSIEAVILFFVIYTILAYILELFIDGFVVLVNHFGQFNKYISWCIRFLFTVGFDIVLISAIESNIDGIMISDKNIILFSIISYAIGKIFESAIENNAIIKKKVKNGLEEKQREKKEEE